MLTQASNRSAETKNVSEGGGYKVVNVDLLAKNGCFGVRHLAFDRQLGSDVELTEPSTQSGNQDPGAKENWGQYHNSTNFDKHRHGYFSKPPQTPRYRSID